MSCSCNCQTCNKHATPDKIEIGEGFVYMEANQINGLLLFEDYDGIDPVILNIPNSILGSNVRYRVILEKVKD